MKKRFLVAALLILLAAGVGGSVWFYNALWGCRSSARVEIEIDEGSSARQILRLLEREGVAGSTLASRLYLRGWGQGRRLHYGRYVFDAGMRPGRVLIGRVDWIAAIAPEAPSLEGFLFPDTYTFAVGISAENAAQHLVSQFLYVFSNEPVDDAEPWGSVLEIVTLASLVEAETSIDSERALVAGVYLNRLRRGMLLQCDPTVVYALKRRNEWSGRLYRIHWEVDDPYNTYRNPGLPPGPINSPGRAALAAALHPESTPYLYFVAKPGGGHQFSRTLSEHNRAVARWRNARR